MEAGSLCPAGERHVGGTDQALKRLKSFIRNELANYPVDRNKPERDGTSRLSAYLHFGHIGPHTVALAVQKADAPKAAKEAYLEQLIVRRELAINFVRFNPDYDNFESGHRGRTRAWLSMPPIRAKSIANANWKMRRRMIRCGTPRKCRW